MIGFSQEWYMRFAGKSLDEKLCLLMFGERNHFSPAHGLKALGDYFTQLLRKTEFAYKNLGDIVAVMEFEEAIRRVISLFGSHCDGIQLVLSDDAKPLGISPPTINGGEDYMSAWERSRDKSVQHNVYTLPLPVDGHVYEIFTLKNMQHPIDAESDTEQYELYFYPWVLINDSTSYCCMFSTSDIQEIRFVKDVSYDLPIDQEGEGISYPADHFERFLHSIGFRRALLATYSNPEWKEVAGAIWAPVCAPTYLWSVRGRDHDNHGHMHKALDCGYYIYWEPGVGPELVYVPPGLSWPGFDPGVIERSCVQLAYMGRQDVRFRQAFRTVARGEDQIMHFLTQLMQGEIYCSTLQALSPE